MEFGLKPYNFEPEYTEEELVELATASDENSGYDGSSQQTCRCTHCRFQTAIVEEEKTCCVDNDLTVSNLEDYCCITDHPSFHTIMLNRTLLEVAYIQSLAYKSHVTAPAVLSNRYVPLSLSLSVFWGCYKSGGGEGRCVVSCACRLNLSGKGTCKLTQLIMKQTSKLSSVICKVRIRSQQTNSPLLSPDTRACTHTHTHTHSDFLWHMFYFQTFHTRTFVSVHCTFVLMILFFIHFRQYRLAAYRLTVTQHSAFCRRGRAKSRCPRFRLLLDAHA